MEKKRKIIENIIIAFLSLGIILLLGFLIYNLYQDRTFNQFRPSIDKSDKQVYTNDVDIGFKELITGASIGVAGYTLLNPYVVPSLIIGASIIIGLGILGFFLRRGRNEKVNYQSE